MLRRTFDVKKEVQDEWNVWGDELLKRTVWASGCRSWYKNGTTNGRISALYPGSILHFVSGINFTKPNDGIQLSDNSSEGLLREHPRGRL